MINETCRRCGRVIMEWEDRVVIGGFAECADCFMKRRTSVDDDL